MFLLSLKVGERRADFGESTLFSLLLLLLSLFLVLCGLYRPRHTMSNHGRWSPHPAVITTCVIYVCGSPARLTSQNARPGSHGTVLNIDSHVIRACSPSSCR